MAGANLFSRSRLVSGLLAAVVVTSCGDVTHQPTPDAGGIGGAEAGGSSGSTGSGGEAAVGSVSCGNFSVPKDECTAGEYCCSGSCVAHDAPCTGYAFHCDDASDCPGAVCCVDKLSTLDGGLQVARCQPACDPDTQLIVCNAPNDGCPEGMSCEITATLPPEYGYCCPAGELCSAT